MAFNIKQLKQINQQSQDIVFGYIRKVKKDLSLDNIIIPELIGFVCLAYYYLSEYFCKLGVYAQVDEEKTTIYNIHSKYKYATGYGAIKIVSTEPRIHKWKFRINAAREYMSIGIDGDGFKSVESGVHFKNTTNYTLMCRGNKTKNGTASFGAKYCPNGYGKGDIVEMILDLSVGSISFVINSDNKLGAAYKNIQQNADLNYRMTVSTFDKGDSATLLQYVVQ